MKDFASGSKIWLVVFSIIFTVFSFASMTMARQIQTKTNVLAECFEPGTECSDYAAKSESNRQRIQDEQGRCLLVAFKMSDADPLSIYDSCVKNIE